jgi:hypothetical protein
MQTRAVIARLATTAHRRSRRCHGSRTPPCCSFSLMITKPLSWERREFGAPGNTHHSWRICAHYLRNRPWSHANASAGQPWPLLQCRPHSGARVLLKAVSGWDPHFVVLSRGRPCLAPLLASRASSLARGARARTRSRAPAEPVPQVLSPPRRTKSSAHFACSDSSFSCLGKRLTAEKRKESGKGQEER